MAQTLGARFQASGLISQSGTNGPTFIKVVRTTAAMQHKVTKKNFSPHYFYIMGKY
jgi:hypothetical protein